MFDPSNVARISTPLIDEDETLNLAYYGFQAERPQYHLSRSESEFSAHSAASNNDATEPESLHAMYPGSHHEDDELRVPGSPGRHSPESSGLYTHCFSPAELFLMGNSGRESALASGTSTPSVATTGTGTSTPNLASNGSSPSLQYHHSGGHHQSKFGHVVINAQGRRVHQCFHCDKQFTTSGHLARHCRIHTGERKFTCPVESCGAMFARRDNCTTHLKKHFVGKHASGDGSDGDSAKLLQHYQSLLKEQHLDHTEPPHIKDESLRPSMERRGSSGTSHAESSSASPGLQPIPDTTEQDQSLRRRASMLQPLSRSVLAPSARSTDDLLLGLHRHQHHAHPHAAHQHAHIEPSAPTFATAGGPHLPHHHQQPHPKPAHVQAGGVRKPALERGSSHHRAAPLLSRASSRSSRTPAVQNPSSETVALQPPLSEPVANSTASFAGLGTEQQDHPMRDEETFDFEAMLAENLPADVSVFPNEDTTGGLCFTLMESQDRHAS
jgi:hypothetical protein